MAWTILNFGKHKGKTLLQVLFTDPDWFFYFYEENRFWGRYAKEAEDLYHKARSIRIPQKEGEDLLATYRLHKPTKKFGEIEVVSREKLLQYDSSLWMVGNVFDLALPRYNSAYDKLGNKHFLQDLKFYLLGNEDRRFTKKWCEAFFNDDTNFLLGNNHDEERFLVSFAQFKAEAEERQAILYANEMQDVQDYKATA